jgi:hypothetical protein
LGQCNTTTTHHTNQTTTTSTTTTTLCMAWHGMGMAFSTKGAEHHFFLDYYHHRQQHTAIAGRGLFGLWESGFIGVGLAWEIPLVLRFRSGLVWPWCSSGWDRVGTLVEAAPSYRRMHTRRLATRRLFIRSPGVMARCRLPALSSTGRPSQLLYLPILTPEAPLSAHATSIGPRPEPITSDTGCRVGTPLFSRCFHRIRHSEQRTRDRENAHLFFLFIPLL